MNTDDNEAKSQPAIDSEKFEELKKENEMLRKKVTMLEVENERLSSEQKEDRQKGADAFDELDVSEANVLKLMQPPGNTLDVFNVSQLLGISPTKAQDILNKLTRDGYVHNSVIPELPGVRSKSSTYSLTAKGIRFLVDHNLAG